MKEQTLAMAADQGAGFERFRRRTKREDFPDAMNTIVPWAALCAVIEPHYPKAGNGQRWPRASEQIPNFLKWISWGQAASAEGRGSESKYTTSGVRACRLECGPQVL